MSTQSNIRVGKPDVEPSTPSHVRGVYRGNAPGHLGRSDGIEDHGASATGSARRSTGINHQDRDPIDPRMPKLSPP